MTPQSIIQIPKSAWPDILAFLSLSIDDLQRVVECLSALDPVSDVEDMAERCAEGTAIDADTIESILGLGVNLSRLRRAMEVSEEEVVSRFRENIEASDS